MDQVLQLLGAPHRVGRACVYAKLLWLGWQRQSARLVVKGLALGVSAALTYVALLAVLVVTVWAGRGAWWSGPLWLLAAAAVQRAVARWADRIPDRGRLPLPVPGEGLAGGSRRDCRPCTSAWLSRYWRPCLSLCFHGASAFWQA